jgi:hypothetical protein
MDRFRRYERQMLKTILQNFSRVIYEAWPDHIKGTVNDSYGNINGRVHITKGLSVQYWSKGDLFATKNNAIYKSSDKGISWHKVAVIHIQQTGIHQSIIKKISNLKLFGLLRKPYPIPFRVLDNGTLLAVSNGIYRAKLKENEVVKLEKVHHGPRCLAQGWAEDLNGTVFYGEYQLGDHPFTRLYWSDDSGKTWHVKQKFPRSEIEHIHSVTFDRHRKLLWLTTGDLDHESRILFSSDQGNTFSELGSGSQNWRVVTLKPTAQAVYWGTDKPTGMNHLLRWNWATGSHEILLRFRNPFYYSVKDSKENIYFSTGAEKPEFGGEIYSDLWRVTPDSKADRLVRWPRGNLEYSGMFLFAQGKPPNGWIAFSPMNLKGHHFETIVFEVGNKKSDFQSD